ncbi:MAG: DUF4359 domain-containing protein [Cyanobacteria bacterium]|nr:DUF4359 domain-containing protein [Cyanobacteria bacterium bin.51]
MTIRWRTFAIAAAGLGGGALALAFTNPGPPEFEDFASEQLVERAIGEVCGPDGLPAPLRLVIKNCPELIRGQRQMLGSLAGRSSQRQNFGLFSLYRTAIGGPSVLPFLSLPTYHALTLAGAGQFVILRTSSDANDSSPGNP